MRGKKTSVENIVMLIALRDFVSVTSVEHEMHFFFLFQSSITESTGCCLVNNSLRSASIFFTEKSYFCRGCGMPTTAEWRVHTDMVIEE